MAQSILEDLKEKKSSNAESCCNRRIRKDVKVKECKTFTAFQYAKRWADKNNKIVQAICPTNEAPLRWTLIYLKE